VVRLTDCGVLMVLGKVLASDDGPVSALAAAPGGSWVTGGNDGTVRLWTAACTNTSGRSAIKIDGEVSDCTWIPGGSDLCIATNRGLLLFSLEPPNSSYRLRTWTIGQSMLVLVPQISHPVIVLRALPEP